MLLSNFVKAFLGMIGIYINNRADKVEPPWMWAVPSNSLSNQMKKKWKKEESWYCLWFLSTWGETLFLHALDNSDSPQQTQSSEAREPRNHGLKPLTCTQINFSPLNCFLKYFYSNEQCLTHTSSSNMFTELYTPIFKSIYATFPCIYLKDITLILVPYCIFTPKHSDWCFKIRNEHISVLKTMAGHHK
jgi:hypothetical protein